MNSITISAFPGSVLIGDLASSLGSRVRACTGPGEGRGWEVLQLARDRFPHPQYRVCAGWRGHSNTCVRELVMAVRGRYRPASSAGMG